MTSALCSQMTSAPAAPHYAPTHAQGIENLGKVVACLSHPTVTSPPVILPGFGSVTRHAPPVHANLRTSNHSPLNENDQMLLCRAQDSHSIASEGTNKPVAHTRCQPTPGRQTSCSTQRRLPHHSVVEACKEKTSLDIPACSLPSNANLVCQDTSVNKRGIWYRTLAAPSTAAQAITALYPLPGVAGPTHHVGCKLHVLLDSGLALHLNSKTCHRGSTASQYHYYSCPLRI